MFFFFQAEDGIRDHCVTGVQTCALPIWMQDLAREMNLSETAFLQPGDDGYALRWFTPAVEVALCGHATLASAHRSEERRVGKECRSRWSPDRLQELSSNNVYQEYNMITV